MTEDEMVGWHHQLNGHEFEQASGDGEGQGSLSCCCPQGCKELHTTERLNNNKILVPCKLQNVDERTEGETNERKIILYSQIKRINIVKISILPGTTYKFNAITINIGTCPMAQPVKKLPAVQETQEMQVRSLDQEDFLKEGMVPHASILP